MLRRAATLALGGLGGLGATAALAQDADLPAFQTCIDIEADRYEWSLAVHRSRALEAADFHLWEVLGVEYCGTVAITRCDRSEAPIACQQALVAEQVALRERVIADLPDPAAVAATDPPLAKNLYTRAHALARGISAGPDCAGAEDPLRTWCEAREANNRLQDAVLAWQVARYLGVAKTARAAGWAHRPPPVRPRTRPGP
ncbi:MAG: hypothetical protein EP318_05225 [Rhodobacteraceae bacterium]|nr:MAG: hypothetical protein EP318_05225 [Paracoccaceae bacterium]